MTDMPRPLDGVIFDKDGTLFDFTATWDRWAAGFLRRMADGDEARAAAMAAAIGYDLAAGAFARDSLVIAGTQGEVAAALAPHFPDLAPPALLDLLNTETGRAPQAEAVPLRPFLADLRARGLVLGIATNDAEAPARAHLTSVGVTEAFDFIAGFDSGFGGKPAPGQLEAFCAATGLAPARVAMVGDSLHDLRAGRAAGMRTVAVLTGVAHGDTLAPHADVVLPDIGHLPAWLDDGAPGAPA